jgi:hypothetical protein
VAAHRRRRLGPALRPVAGPGRAVHGVRRVGGARRLHRSGRSIISGWAVRGRLVVLAPAACPGPGEGRVVLFTSWCRDVGEMRAYVPT